MLALQISQIPGVAQVTIGGAAAAGGTRADRPGEARRKALTLEDVRGVIAEATVNAAKGTLRGDKQSFAIYDNDQLQRPLPTTT